MCMARLEGETTASWCKTKKNPMKIPTRGIVKGLSRESDHLQGKPVEIVLSIAMPMHWRKWNVIEISHFPSWQICFFCAINIYWYSTNAKKSLEMWKQDLKTIGLLTAGLGAVGAAILDSRQDQHSHTFVSVEEPRVCWDTWPSSWTTTCFCSEKS